MCVCVCFYRRRSTPASSRSSTGSSRACESRATGVPPTSSVESSSWRTCFKSFALWSVALDLFVGAILTYRFLQCELLNVITKFMRTPLCTCKRTFLYQRMPADDKPCLDSCVQVIATTNFDFECNTKCEYHEEEDVLHCALGTVKKYA